MSVLHNLGGANLIHKSSVLYWFVFRSQNREDVGSYAGRVHPGGGGGRPAAEEHGHFEDDLHASQVCHEYPENYPVHEDGVSCQVS